MEEEKCNHVWIDKDDTGYAKEMTCSLCGDTKLVIYASIDTVFGYTPKNILHLKNNK